MKLARLALVAAGCVAAMLAVSGWAYPHLQDGPIAVHWGMDGKPDGYAGKTQALLMMPALAACISVLFAALPPIMPRRSRLEPSALAYGVTWIGALLVLAVCHVAVLAKAMGAAFDIARPVTFAIAVLMLAIGNYMGKIRYNYVFGMRTPWTLSSERVWDKTHRLVGRWMVACALVLALAAMLTPQGEQGMAVLVVTTTLCALLPAIIGLVYSILLSRRLERA